MLQRVFTHQIPSIPLQSMITCSGWLSTIRDHGGIVFFQFRDRFGTLQCVYDPAEFHDIDVHDLKPETVVSVQGILLERPDGTKQPTDKLGHLELHVKKVTIHSKATALPFQVSESHKINEELRLQYRYIDLRHPERAHPFFVRSEVNHLIREFLRKHDFIECETPILTKPTPEGARAYIVPSRIHLHNFYALAQSPQLYKQLMMAAGFERYYQIARCFRDEDLRADRQPEFTQLDIEMSFIDERMIQDLIEQLVRQIFTTVLNVNLPTFKRMTYDEAMKRYGSDKPDLRCPLYFVDVKEILKKAGIAVFEASLNNPGHIAVAMRLPGRASDLSRKDFDQMTDFVKQRGASGLAYLKYEAEGLTGPIAKVLSKETQEEIIAHTDLHHGDVLFLAIGGADRTYSYFSALRELLRDRFDLIDMQWAPLWVVDFPMFEWDEDGKRYQAKHHPFTAPKSVECDDLLQWVSRGYDFVLNGYEVGGGSIRIHDEEMQARIFEIIGLSDEQAHAKFGFLLEAFRYGFPPHGGIALGIDRLIMLMTGTKNVRDVILFPKTQSAYCPLTSAPNVVSSDQLKELGLELKKQPTKS